MPKIDGNEIATSIFDRFIDALRDYAEKMEEVFVEGLKKWSDSQKLDLHVEHIVKVSFNLNRDMVQPLEHIRDEVSKCKSPKEFESVVDSLIKLFQDKVLAATTYSLQQNQPLLDIWNQYFQTLGALAAEIDDYCVKQYFPTQKDFVNAKVKVSKGFLTPAPLVPIKVYFGSDCIQYAYTTSKGEWMFKLPKGQEFTFWTLKEGEEVSKSVLLSGNTKVKL